MQSDCRSESRSIRIRQVLYGHIKFDGSEMVDAHFQRVCHGTISFPKKHQKRWQRSTVLTTRLWVLCNNCQIKGLGDNRPIRLTQCCTQFKSPGDKILCVLYLHYNVAFTFKWYGNSWNRTFYSQRVWIGYNNELAELVYYYSPNPDNY